jgi:hypothetical protein
LSKGVIAKSETDSISSHVYQSASPSVVDRASDNAPLVKQERFDFDSTALSPVAIAFLVSLPNISYMLTPPGVEDAKE